MPLVEAAIRKRADELGRWTPSSLPAGVSEWVPFLLQREWRGETELCTAAAGKDRSFFVDATGALLFSGHQEAPGLLDITRGIRQAALTSVVPTPLPSMAGVRVRTVVCHEDSNLAVSEAGQVFAWGHQGPSDETSWREGAAVKPTLVLALQNHRVCQVAAGRYHCAALTEDGALSTRPTRRLYGSFPPEPIPELGYGSFVPDSRAPHRVFALEGVRVIAVATGDEFTVAVTDAGAVYSFGRGDGRLGHGGRQDFDKVQGVFLPKRIEALEGVLVATVAAGDAHVLALTRCGRVYSWGAGADDVPEHGRGSGREVGKEHQYMPHVIEALRGKRVRAVAARVYASCVVTDAGALYTWGTDYCGNLGHGDVGNEDRPKLVRALRGIRMVGASICIGHGLALAADGSVYSFGEGPALGIRQEAEQATRGARRIPDLVCRVPRR
jgi:alpha-tubulin suppressor-like RCC1 family protein